MATTWLVSALHDRQKELFTDWAFDSFQKLSVCQCKSNRQSRLIETLAPDNASIS